MPTPRRPSRPPSMTTACCAGADDGDAPLEALDPRRPADRDRRPCVYRARYSSSGRPGDLRNRVRRADAFPDLFPAPDADIFSVARTLSFPEPLSLALAE